jgi:hypothetical protein
MVVEARLNISNIPFIRQGLPMALIKDNETFIQDAGRSGDLVAHTVVAYNPTTTKWVPFTDETATNGQQYPRGIILDTLTEAAIKAGDVTGVRVLVGDAVVDEDNLVIENSKTLATIINVPTNYNSTVEDELRKINIFMQNTVDVASFENS